MITPREVMQNNDELILSNISNSMYVQCNEFGKWKEIKTDKYGFNNKDVKSKYNILIAGDSFAHGFCVDKSKEVHEVLTSMNVDTYSIGIAANGPMISLASMELKLVDFLSLTASIFIQKAVLQWVSHLLKMK